MTRLVRLSRRREDACDIREDLGQEGMDVKIAFPVSHNVLTISEEYIQ